VRGLRPQTAAARNFARQLRQKSTFAEKRLWRLLRDRRFNGFKFRRQYPCGKYFLDFYCPEARLAIELDGGEHGFPERRQKDAVRDEFLKANGIKVLRFWNRYLLAELRSVRFEIWRALMERSGQRERLQVFLSKSNDLSVPQTPHPGPLPSEGRGDTFQCNT
jgi:very-short-patch-repair endonuclease